MQSASPELTSKVTSQASMPGPVLTAMKLEIRTSKLKQPTSLGRTKKENPPKVCFI
jgi:hypothetical protein